MSSYHSVLRCASFLHSLVDLDGRVSGEVRSAGCPCGGSLHWARFPRKPRGVPREVEQKFSKRLSLCCGKPDCRQRRTPPSVCFLGRRVYMGVAFILLSMLRHGVTDEREEQLRREFHAEFPVDERTLRRWREWWRDLLPVSPFWRVARTRLRNPVSSGDLPGGLVQSFVGTAAQQLASALQFLSPLSTSSCRSGSGSAMAS